LASGTPLLDLLLEERYFTEIDPALSTTRSAEQLAEFRARLVETVRAIRSGDELACAAIDRAAHEIYFDLMRLTRISQGGQIQVPAEVRRRWRTSKVVIEDLGNEISVRPVPEDPITAALEPPIKSSMTADEFLRATREEEAIAEERKWGDGSRRVGTHWRAGGATGQT
jgi:bifunctional DNA-binding transcriptional regulator/antitoxin component of YhaV-PrlF toxin-antitoxin module